MTADTSGIPQGRTPLLKGLCMPLQTSHVRSSQQSGLNVQRDADCESLLRALHASITECKNIVWLIHASYTICLCLQEKGYVTADVADAEGLHQLKLSGTKFRKMLRAGEDIPEW